MKKKMGFMLVLIMLIALGIHVVFAITADTKAPTVSYLTFDKETVKPGDKIYLTTDINDDVSGIDSAYLTVKRIKENNGTYFRNTEDVNKALSVNYEGNRPFVIVPDNYIGGLYYIHEIKLTDKEGNQRYYYTKESSQFNRENYNYLLENNYLYGNPSFDEWEDKLSGNFDIERSNISVKFTVEAQSGETTDQEAPYVAAFDMGNRKVNYSDTYQFTLKPFDDSNRPISISVGLSNGTSLSMEGFDISRNTIARFTFTPSQSKTIGKVSIEYVILTDIYGNTAFYLIDGYKGKLSYDYYQKICKRCEVLRNDLYFEVIDDGTKDDEKPVLKNVKIEKNEYPIPSFAKLELTATDNKKLADTAYVTFKNGSKEISAMLTLEEDNIYRGELDINQYSEIGEYKLTDVNISDAAGNGVIYSNYDHKYKDEDLKVNLSFKLTSIFTPDITTSTTDLHALQLIHDAKDDAIIAMDATSNPMVSKYIFGEIQGTNKELHIESNGVEWVFKGKDITQPKDIDTSMEIVFDYNFEDFDSSEYLEKALFLKFASNGDLPGIAGVRIKLDYAFRKYLGEKAYVYHYNPDDTKIFTEINENILELNGNGWFVFRIKHTSTYVLSSKKPDQKYVKVDKEIVKINNELKANTKDEKDSKKCNLKICIALGIFAIIVIILIIVMIKKNKNKKDSDKKDLEK